MCAMLLFPVPLFSAWEAFVDLHDGMGFRLCGTWDLEPPQTAVKTVVMDHILRIVMD